MLDPSGKPCVFPGYPKASVPGQVRLLGTLPSYINDQLAVSVIVADEGVPQTYEVFGASLI